MYCFFYEPFNLTKVSWFCCCFLLGLVVFFSLKVWWIKRSLQLIPHHHVILPHQDKVSFAIERYYLSLLICVKEAVRFPPISTKQKLSQMWTNIEKNMLRVVASFLMSSLSISILHQLIRCRYSNSSISQESLLAGYFGN